MKSIFVLVFVSFSSFAQVMTFNESMSVLDQYADGLSKVEVGMQILNETYVMKPDCVDRTKTSSTIVEIKDGVALVFNEKKETLCTGDIKDSKFLTHDPLITMAALKAAMMKQLHSLKVERKDNIMTWRGFLGASEYTFQYDLNSHLFANWVHHHRTDPGPIENHNIKYPAPRRVVSPSELQGIRFCERDPLTLKVHACN